MGTITVSVVDPTANVTANSTITISDNNISTLYNWTLTASGNTSMNSQQALYWWVGWFMNNTSLAIQAWELQQAIANLQVNTISTSIVNS